MHNSQCPQIPTSIAGGCDFVRCNSILNSDANHARPRHSFTGVNLNVRK